VDAQMIHYIQPYSREKNIGGAINSAIRQLNAHPSDWVVLTDHDVLWLLPDSKAQIENILLTTNFDVLGPVTNRLALNAQLHEGVFDVYDIREHIKVAKERQQQCGNHVQQFDNFLAAFCLCFRVSTWQKLGGFTENDIQFDSIFCIKAQASGMKLGLMLGVYLYHLYRTGSDNPRTDYKHLIQPH
jgi:GT2 family glycosyltransferase